MRESRLLESLTDAQRAAVLHPGTPLLVVAGPGTGKTFTLTTRIAYRVASGALVPRAVMALTHSTRAAGQLRTALVATRVPGVEAVPTRTVHAAALSQLQFAHRELGVGPEVRICPDVTLTVRDAAARVLGECSPRTAAALASSIGRAKALLLEPATYAARADARLPVPAQQFTAIADRYAQALSRRGVLDHTDLLTRAAAQVRQEPLVAAQVARRTQFLLVDEYQDTDPAQQDLLDAWLDGRTDLTCVGDPRQAVYAFKGSDPVVMSQFLARYGEAAVVQLNDSFRSSPSIVQLANRCRAHVEADLADLTSKAASGPTPVVRRLPDEYAEVRWVAAQIRGALNAGTRPGQVAILARTNGSVDAAEKALQELDVPTSRPGSVRFFEEPAVRAVVASMRAELERGFTLGGLALLRQVLAESGFDAQRPVRQGEAGRIWSLRSALLAWVEALPSPDLLGGTYLVAELDQAASFGHQAPTDCVFVSTVHQAKGLEFDAVFVLGVDETWSPQDQGANLLYVALTRARRHVTLTWPTNRQGRATGPSVLLEDFHLVSTGSDTSVPGPANGAPPRHAPRRKPTATTTCRRCRRPLEPAATTLGVCAEHLTGEPAAAWARVLTWRAQESTMSGRSPGQVLPDRVALAMLARRPRTLDDLRDVPGIGPGITARHGLDLLSLMWPAPGAASCR